MQLFNDVQFYGTFVLFGCIGALFGGFYGVVLFRTKALKDKNIPFSITLWMMTMIIPSKCDFCKIKLKWYDYWPVLGYFFLKGKTKCCNNTIPVQYLLFEVLGMSIGFLTYFALISYFYIIGV